MGFRKEEAFDTPHSAERAPIPAVSTCSSEPTLYSLGLNSGISLSAYRGAKVRSISDWQNLTTEQRSAFLNHLDIGGRLLAKISTRWYPQGAKCDTCKGRGTLHRGERHPGIHPSSITGCPRAIYFNLIGAEEKEILSASDALAYEIGHALHQMLQGYISQLWEEEVQVETEVGLRIPELYVVGSADIVLANSHLRLGVEIKTASANAISSLSKPDPQYLAQATAYCKALDLPGMLFLYIEKDRPHRLVQFFYGFDQQRWDGIERDLRGIIGFLDVDGVPPRGEKTNDYQCKKRCKFRFSCEFGVKQ